MKASSVADWSGHALFIYFGLLLQTTICFATIAVCNLIMLFLILQLAIYMLLLLCIV